MHSIARTRGEGERARATIFFLMLFFLKENEHSRPASSACVSSSENHLLHSTHTQLTRAPFFSCLSFFILAPAPAAALVLSFLFPLSLSNSSLSQLAARKLHPAWKPTSVSSLVQVPLRVHEVVSRRLGVAEQLFDLLDLLGGDGSATVDLGQNVGRGQQLDGVPGGWRGRTQQAQKEEKKEKTSRFIPKNKTHTRAHTNKKHTPQRQESEKEKHLNDVLWPIEAR